MSHLLVLNAGSSSLKAALFACGDPPEPVLRGAVEEIGAEARLAFGGEAAAPLAGAAGLDHAAVLDTLLAGMAGRVPGMRVAAVGHRIVHGGADFAEPVPLDAASLAALERLVPLAPLHQPHNLAGARAAMAAFPDALQIGCFDTAFHRHHPLESDLFALPREYYARGVRRYGFHGLSYASIAGQLAQHAPGLHAGRVAVAHLGAGASICGMRGGRSVASSMGFSALDGLPMATRPGQIDPGVLLWLMTAEGMDAAALSDLLYHRSGLLGLSGLSGDMRVLEAAGTPETEEAIGYFTYRVRREIGATAAALGGLDGIVFTGGIGENSARVRAEVCASLGWLGVEIDAAANADHAASIALPGAAVKVLVIPTDEERVIAHAAQAALEAAGGA